MEGDVDPMTAARMATETDDGGTAEFDAGDESDRTSALKEMLTSTEPNVTPQSASGTLDLSTPWHNHVEAGLQKMTHSEGTPAWAHLVTGLLAYVAENAPARGSGGDDDGGGGGDGDDLVAAEEVVG